MQTSNKFALLEESEIEIHKQIKKEAAENELHKEEVDVRKAADATTSSIGKATRKATPKKIRIQIVDKEVPNPSETGLIGQIKRSQQLNALIGDLGHVRRSRGNSMSLLIILSMRFHRKHMMIPRTMV